MAQLTARGWPKAHQNGLKTCESETSCHCRRAGSAAVSPGSEWHAALRQNEMPQLPPITVIMPGMTLGAMSGTDNCKRSSWVWASMKPGRFDPIPIYATKPFWGGERPAIPLAKSGVSARENFALYRQKCPAAQVAACAPVVVRCNVRLGFLPRSLYPTRMASTDRNVR